MGIRHRFSPVGCHRRVPVTTCRRRTPVTTHRRAPWPLLVHAQARARARHLLFSRSGRSPHAPPWEDDDYHCTRRHGRTMTSYERRRCYHRLPALLPPVADAATTCHRAATSTTGHRRCYHRLLTLLPQAAGAATTGRQCCNHRSPALLPHRPPVVHQSATSAAAIRRRRCSNRPPVLLPAGGGVFLPWVIGGATVENEDATMSHQSCYHRPPDLLAWAIGCATMSGRRCCKRCCCIGEQLDSLATAMANA
jgi:hypothetical protein